MKINVTINGTKVPKEIPTSWNEVNFKQFLGLQDCGNDRAKALALITDIDYDVLVKAKIDNIDLVLMALSFIDRPLVYSVPKELIGYAIPKDLNFESIAQFQDLKEAIKDIDKVTPKEALERFTLYCAIYACTPYDWKKAESMQDQFLYAPCQEVLGIGNFTLVKLIGLSLNIAQGSQKASTPLKKFKRALIAFRFRLAFILRSFIWKKKQVTNVMNS